MSEIKITEEKPLTMAETKELIEKKEGGKIKRTTDYINRFTKMKPKEAREITEKINKLGLTRLKERTIAKIVDIMPEDIDSLKMILTQENLTLKQEDLQKILECLK